MKKKTDFKPFKVGTIFNLIAGGPYKAVRKYNHVKIRYPSRLNLMAIDPSKIASNDNLVYTPGEYILKVNIYRTVSVKINNKPNSIHISDSTKRKSLVQHAALLMKEALRFKEGLDIDVDNSREIRHVGLGSSSALIACVACAINEIYGKPIRSADMVQYLAQNHGEEIDATSEYINPVQCIGGSAAGGQYSGALMILAGRSRVIRAMNVSGKYKVVIGIPRDYVELDSEELLQKEQAVFHKFIDCGKAHGPEIAYTTLHSVLPAMTEGDLKSVGDLVYDYRFNMGSIENCSYTYPPLVGLASKLAYLKEKGFADILSISSVGPAFVAVTKTPRRVVDAFATNNMKTLVVDIENSKYKVLLADNEK